ncbi:hypothetical protein CBR_g44584 [Chara braunii]|uniref:Reverse transcriptase n=1 Tax=Chara braunii TaxID=69332 RepID=A0A388LXT8_CHABU|nr:hypothetical protein CBR_g44584 [Chara braunii]|eukprot:GBG87127.1 hypothetical protein CBR_g44584 [Chara braunii]
MERRRESSICFASKEDGCTPWGVAGFNETQSQELLKLTLEFGGLGDRESVGCLVVNTIVRHKLDGVLDVEHRWDAGARERRGENVMVLSNEVTDCGLQGEEDELEALNHRKSRVLQVVVDGLAEVEVVAMVTLWRQRSTNVLLTILERAEAAREVAALLRGTAGATTKGGTTLGSVVRGGGGVACALRLGGGGGVKTGSHLLMVPGGLAPTTDGRKKPTRVVEMEVVHTIEIIPGSSILKGRIYRMSPGELDELRRQLKEFVEKGWIRPSVSPYGSPVLFVPKTKEGTLRMCIDYSEGLNAITVKNIDPLPHIGDLLDKVQGCRYFSKIDMKFGYHQIAIRPEDQHKTAFQTRYGLYEFVVMPFGLCNAPGTFQRAMNRIFHDYLDKFVIVYFDDILIFNKTVEEHVAHLDKVLSLLRQHKFKINGEKCEFGCTRVLYLGHEIFAEGLKPDDAKVASIHDWPHPQSVTEMRSSLGMTSYYRNFVKNYSIVAAPLTDLTRLDTPWEWTERCEAAFRHLKHALTHYEVLKLPDPDKSFIVTTDASQYGIGVVLAQQEGTNLRPVEYMSKKMPSQKLAKSTYEKELYAVYKALTRWRHYLLGRFFILRTDHQTLRWMRTQPVLSDALKRWIKVIEQYDFEPQYIKGEYNKVVDALMRRRDFSGALITEFNLADSVAQSLVEAYREDPFMAEIVRRLEAKDKGTSAEFELVNDLLFLEKAGNKRLCVPSREFLRSLFLGECHYATGHFGYKKTAANLLQRLWWPTMMRDAQLYVETCQVCQRDKPRTQAPLGLLKPLLIPERPGESSSMDFMDTLVTSKSGMRHIFFIVDRFSKYARLIAMPKTAKTEYVIRLFKENWVMDFGLPKSIVSDRDVRFTSELWKAAAAEQGTQLQMTSRNHPEANGQAKQLNHVVQHLLRHYIKPNQVDWDEKIALIAILYNNAIHSATGMSPNSLLLTFKPRLTLDFLLPENQSTAAPGTFEFAYRSHAESQLWCQRSPRHNGLPVERQGQIGKLSTAGSDSMTLWTPSEPVTSRVTALRSEAHAEVDSPPLLYSFEDYAALLVRTLGTRAQGQDVCAASSPSDSGDLSSSSGSSRDSASEFNIEVLDPLTFEDFAWLPLPTTGRLPGPQCATLCAHLHTYLLFYAAPTSQTDDEVAVGDILPYVTKVAREFLNKRYADNNAPLLYVRIQVGQASCSVLLDSGVSRKFMSQAFMQKAGLGAQVRRKANPTTIKLAGGRTQQLIDRYIEAVKVYFAPHACEPVTFDILDTDFDIILGMPWLASADHTVNFRRRTLTVCDAFGAEVSSVGGAGDGGGDGSLLKLLEAAVDLIQRPLLVLHRVVEAMDVLLLCNARCQQVYDKSVRGFVYACSGGASSKMQFPKDEKKAGLLLQQPYLVFQIFIPSSQHFSIELRYVWKNLD